MPVLLFPRLTLIAAKNLAVELAQLSPHEAQQRSAVSHPAATFAPTGGSRVSTANLTELQSGIRALACSCGYPAQTDANYRRFDTDGARFLVTQMPVTASEASRQDVWAFIACVLLPDLVRWRFPGREGTTVEERFLGGARGIRNALGRLWWRGYLLGADGADGWSGLGFLGEDELVQLMERPNLSGDVHLLRTIANTFRGCIDGVATSERETLMREATKRLRRRLAYVATTTLNPRQVSDLVREVFLEAGGHLPEEGELVPQPVSNPAVPEHPSQAPVTKPVLAPPSPQPFAGANSHHSETETAESSVISIVFEHRVESNNPVTEVAPSPGDGLLQRLDAAKVEHIDKRATGGRLWIIGGATLRLLVGNLKEEGYKFVYAQNGSRSTQHRPAWYLLRTSKK
jgi:hypothetical protein